MAPQKNRKAPTLMIWYFDMLTSNETGTVGKERGQVRERLWLRGGGAQEWWECVCVWELGLNLRSVKTSGRICVARRDKTGSLGVRGASSWPPNPQAQPSLQGIPQIWLSGSPRRWASSASRFNMLCVPAPPGSPPPQPSLSLSGTSLAVSRSLLKAPFKLGDVFG